MHLYTCAMAPNPKRLAALLKYKGISIESTELDIMQGEHFNESFKAINPVSTVPALKCDDGTVLTDTVAICYYLDCLHPEKPLFGNNPLEAAQVIGLMHKIYNEGVSAIAEILRNANPAFKDRAFPGRVNIPQIPDLIVRGRLRLSGFWQDMNDVLQGKQFLVGQQLSQADIDLFVICGFAGWAKETVPEDCVAILSWQQNIQSILE